MRTCVQCERPLLKWLLFDAIVGLLFWVFAGALMAVLPVTFKHLRPVGHLTPRGITRRGVKEAELHDSFFGLYCLWLLWVICVCQRTAHAASPGICSQCCVCA